jgi:hypothetical protein
VALNEVYDCISLVNIKNTKHTQPGESFADNTTSGIIDDGTKKGPALVKVNELNQDRET